jgi:hypothetical protein
MQPLRKLLGILDECINVTHAARYARRDSGRAQMQNDTIEKVTFKEGPFYINALKPGEIQQWGVKNFRWYLACPRCGMALCLRDHTVTIEENGEVTISPSVGHPACGLHMFVKQGRIQYLTDM